MEQQGLEQQGLEGWKPLPYLAVSPECWEDPGSRGLCHHHEVVHLENGKDLDCHREVPRRL
jgi:hypothetical protein